MVALYILFGLMFLSIIVLAVLQVYVIKTWPTGPDFHMRQVPPSQVNVNLKPLQDVMEGIPNKVLQSITSSSSTHKGKLGELIGYLQLRASYDRIIPLGDIVDFLVINFPKDGVPGKITFIDVKTGKSAKLSKDQRIVKQLIEEKRIEFIKLSISEPKDKDGA